MAIPVAITAAAAGAGISAGVLILILAAVGGAVAAGVVLGTKGAAAIAAAAAGGGVTIPTGPTGSISGSGHSYAESAEVATRAHAVSTAAARSGKPGDDRPGTGRSERAGGGADAGCAGAGFRAQGRAPAPAKGTPPAVQRLGLRYNLVQVNPETRESHAVDPNANFSRGTCLAVEFSPSRDGHLYVFNRGSSGDLQLLLPSAAMPGEASLVRAGKTARVPQEYCFMLNDPPGVETLVVAVTEHPEAIEELRRSVGGGSQQMGGRDLIMETVDEPASASEPAHAVYAVQAKAGESSRLVLEIKIRHEKK